MTITVVSIPATLTVDVNNAFTMQGIFNSIYSSLPPPTVVSSTGIVGGITSINPTEGPWSASISGMSSTAGLSIGDRITATSGTGTLYGATPVSCTVDKIGSNNTIEYTVVGGTTPTSGTITNITKYQYTVTGISLAMIGLPCKTEGVIDSYMDIKDAVARLYNYCMKSYLEPIWKVLNELLKALEAVVGSLFSVDLTIPVLNLTISDLFSDNLYNKLTISITNLYNNAREDLLSLLRFLGIPFQPFSGVDSPQTDIASIVKNAMVSLWGQLIKKLADILQAIKTGLTAYDILTNPGSFYRPLTTIWVDVTDAILGKISLFFLTGGPSVQEILNALEDFVKSALKKTTVTAQEILDYLTGFTLPVFGKPFDWDLPFQGGVRSPLKDLNQLLGDIKNYCTNYIALILAAFVKAISSILSVFSLSVSFPVLSINYTACAVVNNPGT